MPTEYRLCAVRTAEELNEEVNGYLLRDGSSTATRFSEMPKSMKTSGTPEIR